MQTVGRSPDISVMWRTEYYAGAGYIRHVAVKRLNICCLCCSAASHIQGSICLLLMNTRLTCRRTTTLVGCMFSTGVNFDGDRPVAEVAGDFFCHQVVHGVVNFMKIKVTDVLGVKVAFKCAFVMQID